MKHRSCFTPVQMALAVTIELFMANENRATPLRIICSNFFNGAEGEREKQEKYDKLNVLRKLEHVALFCDLVLNTVFKCIF